MIHEIAVELRAALVANGCPVPVVDSRDASERGQANAVPRERIVVGRVIGEPEPIVGPKGTGRNPIHIRDRHLAAKVTIWAQSPRPGALSFEHERRCDTIVDQVIGQLVKVLSARKNGGSALGAGRMVEPVDAKGAEIPNFAVYEIPFSVPRAVEMRTWAGAAATEATLGGVGGITLASSTTTSLPGDDPPAAETACGA